MRGAPDRTKPRLLAMLASGDWLTKAELAMSLGHTSPPGAGLGKSLGGPLRSLVASGVVVERTREGVRGRRPVEYALASLQE